MSYDSPILVVDDNKEIHRQILRILSKAPLDPAASQLDSLHNEVFGDAGPDKKPAKRSYNCVSAYQGQEALSYVVEAQKENKPFGLAIVDMRMPPGWDGLETIKRLWEVSPKTQILICSAYSDYSLEQINQELNRSSSYLFLRKPFEVLELEQMVAYMMEKWHLQKD